MLAQKLTDHPPPIPIPPSAMTTKTVVGVIEFTSKYRYGLTSRGAPIFLFRPYDDALPDCIVGSTERDTSRNQIALVDISVCDNPLDQKQKQRANLVKLFGPVGDVAAEKAALLQHYCATTNKSKDAPPVQTADDENREPIDAEHGWITFHIDPPGCRDIDDAVAFHRASGTWAITIADVAAAIPPESDTDRAARAIGSTFYSLEGSVMRPMLPPAISEDMASLLPGQRRRGLTLFIQPNNKERFGLSWITVTHSFTYDTFVGSALAFDLEMSRDPHVWIEELMIRYNKAAAVLLKTSSVGVLRVQPSATAEKVAAWMAIDPVLIHEAASYEPATSQTPQEHATLGLYCHASSPLRRYADLVNQRALKALLQHVRQPTDAHLAVHLNERAQANRRWGRDLTFLTQVTPGRVHEIDVVWASESHVWVPAWRRLICLRHEEVHEPGFRGKIKIFCDPTRRNWKQRVLTACVSDF